MKILLTAPQNAVYDRYFPPFLLAQLASYGEVVRNPFSRSLTADEMAEMIRDADILLTHWGTPKTDAAMLTAAPKLKLIAHAAGSVAHIVSEEVFDKSIPVLSANPVMAKFVAESVLGYMIAGTHRFVQTDRIVRAGGWNKKENEQFSLYGAEIGLIGLGTVGRFLLDLLRPFGCKVFVFDPFLAEIALEAWPFAHLCTFEEAMQKRIVSVHASKTPQTVHLINEQALSLLPDGALLINSARGAIVDTKALIEKCKNGNLYAVLDVYEQEGAGNLPDDLLQCTDCTLLQPHTAASAVSWQMTQAVADDIGRFLKNEPLQYTVSRQQYRLMTQE